MYETAGAETIFAMGRGWITLTAGKGATYLVTGAYEKAKDGEWWMKCELYEIGIGADRSPRFSLICSLATSFAVTEKMATTNKTT